MGYTVNYLSIDQGTALSGEKLGSGGTIGLDLGIQGTFRKRHRIGAFIKNINNSNFEGMPLPKRLNIGIAYSYNKMVELASNEIICMLHPDMYIALEDYDFWMQCRKEELLEREGKPTIKLIRKGRSVKCQIKKRK